MSNVEIKVTGWKAVTIILLVIALAVFQFLRKKESLEDKGREAIKSYLFGTYASQMVMPLLNDAKSAVASDSSIKELTERAEDVSNINILECKARLAFDGDYLVRATFDINGKPPPDGKDVRYFLMSRFIGDSWFVEYEIMAWRYYLAFF